MYQKIKDKQEFKEMMEDAKDTETIEKPKRKYNRKPKEEAPVAAVHITSEQKEAIKLAIGQLEAETERLLKEADKKLEEGSKLNNMAKIYVDNMDELRRMIE